MPPRPGPSHSTCIPVYSFSQHFHLLLMVVWSVSVKKMWDHPRRRNCLSCSQMFTQSEHYYKGLEGLNKTFQLHI